MNTNKCTHKHTIPPIFIKKIQKQKNEVTHDYNRTQILMCISNSNFFIESYHNLKIIKKCKKPDF